MEFPLISVIMPAYNAENFIGESIRSVIHQTYENWELLIIDDASKDNTVEAVKQISEDDERLKLHILPTNQGAGFARNIGIKAAKGTYITFLDADDLWRSQKLEIQLRFMQQHKIDVSFSDYELIDETGKSLNLKIEALPQLSLNKLIRANYIGNLTGMYHNEKLGKVYCPPIRKRQDWAMWIEIVKIAGKAYGIQKNLASYRVRENSISGNKPEMLRYNFNVYRKFLGFSAVKSSAFFTFFLFEQFFIKSRQKKRLKK